MNRQWIVLGIVALVVLGLSVSSWVVAQGSDVAPEGAQAAESVSGSDQFPNATPAIIIPEKYRPPAGGGNVLAAGDTTVYFTPQDNDGNTTVVFLYNTSGTDATVSIEAHELDGSVWLSTSLVVPAYNLVRICSDFLYNPPASWLSAVFVDFADNSAYVKMTMPSGIKVDAYVSWHTGSGYEPGVAGFTVPIRLSSDPAMVFLPATHKNSP